MGGSGDLTPSYPGVSELTRQLDQEKIEMLSKRVHDLRCQNEELKDKITKSENDMHEFVAYFQKENETKDALIRKLNDEVLRKESERSVTVKQMQEKATRELTQLSEEMQATQQHQVDHIKALERDLAALERFREMRDAHEKSMEELAAEMDAKEKAHAQKIHDIERRLLIDKGNMQKDFNKVVEDVRQQAKVEAHNSLGAETKRIAGENRRMAKELNFQTQTTTELQAHSKTLDDRCMSTRRELAILKDINQEYAKQSHSRNKELKRLREQVEVLKRTLATQAVKIKREGEKRRAEVSKQLEEQRLDLGGMRQLLMLKNRELRNLRRLSQYILGQRNEVETFMLEALEDVKRQITNYRQAEYRKAVAEYNQRLRDGSPDKGHLPNIRSLKTFGTEPPSALPTDPEARVDISSLTWEDKERVLRLLFAKINNIRGSVEAVPDHPLDAAIVSAVPSGGAREGVAEGVVDEVDSDLRKPRTFVTQGGGGGGGGGNEKDLTLCYRSYGAHFTTHSRGSEASNGGGVGSIPTSPAIGAVQHEPLPH